MDRVRIPTDLTEHDTFFAWGPIKLSLRQLLILFTGIILWYGAADFFLRPVFGLNLLFGMLACSWLLIISIALAFMKVKGRPVDVWFAEKLMFVFGARTFLLRDPNAKSAVQADLHEDADMDALMEYQRRTKRSY